MTLSCAPPILEGNEFSDTRILIACHSLTKFKESS